MTFDVQVEVMLRPGIADPEGATIERALPALGFEGVTGVTVGKSIRFQLDSESASKAQETATQMCEQFLSNPVIEDAAISVTQAQVGS
ncbi:MAG: phosphoribosylformylglycinamidine synthase subunit PurS [Microthrixaceae bacterium]|nr:phosphoribosylformylglycinamidine synthase subunit PurS [Microthrixaceae bacterium]